MRRCSLWIIWRKGNLGYTIMLCQCTAFTEYFQCKEKWQWKLILLKILFSWNAIHKLHVLIYVHIADRILSLFKSVGIPNSWFFFINATCKKCKIWKTSWTKIMNFFYRIFIQLIVYITQNILNLTCLIWLMPTLFYVRNPWPISHFKC